MRTCTHTFNGPLVLFLSYLGELVPERKNQSGFPGARNSEWQWHQLGHMEICTSPKADNHASTPRLSFLQGHPTNSIKALKALHYITYFCLTAFKYIFAILVLY